MNLYEARVVGRKVQNVLSNYTELENKIRDCTNTDSWGPTSQQLHDVNGWIRDQGHHDVMMNAHEDYPPPAQHEDSVKFIVKRMTEYAGLMSFQNEGFLQRLKKSVVTSGLEHIIVFKCLQLLEYLLINCFASPFDIQNTLQQYKSTLRELSTRYQCVYASDKKPQQHTKMIRAKAKEVLDLLNDEAQLAAKREKLHKAYDRLASLESAPRVASRKPSVSEYVGSLMPRRSGSLRLPESLFDSYDTPAYETEYHDTEYYGKPAEDTPTDADTTLTTETDLLDLSSTPPTQSTPLSPISLPRTNSNYVATTFDDLL